jgi:hypothetical protein
MIYLTRRFLLQNYRDCTAIGFITCYVMAHFLQYNSRKRDSYWTMQHRFTHDESNIEFR